MKCSMPTGCRVTELRSQVWFAPSDGRLAEPGEVSRYMVRCTPAGSTMLCCSVGCACNTTGTSSAERERCFSIVGRMVGENDRSVGGDEIRELPYCDRRSSVRWPGPRSGCTDDMVHGPRCTARASFR